MLLVFLGICLNTRSWFKKFATGVVLTPPASQDLYNPSLDKDYHAAVRLRDSGQLERAASSFDRLAASAHAIGNTSKEARVLLAKGSVQLREFAYRDAAQTYYRVLDLARPLGDVRSTAGALVNLAEIHLQLNDLSAA